MFVRRLLPVLVLFALVPLARAEAPAQSTDAVKVGAPITTKKATSIDKLAKTPKKYVGQTVRVDGTVKQVCQGMGCWVEVASASGATFLAKSLDESVLLPKDCAGRKISVQGVVTEMSAKDTEAHKHEDGIPEGHACPVPTYLISTQGAELAAVQDQKK